MRGRNLRIPEIAVIGGVGFEQEGAAGHVETPFGEVKFRDCRIWEKDAISVQRHGEGHLPPHKVNYRAIIWAIKSLGASRVISINTVGTMSYQPVGGLFIPSDFVEFTKARINTFFEQKAVHVDMSQPYCPELRSCLIGAAREMNVQTYEGVYICAEGPHLESPAQIRMMRQFGDVVGMTGYPEVVLAKELSLCYASLCIVTNEACGMSSGRNLSISLILEQTKGISALIKEMILHSAKRIPAERGCSCKSSLQQTDI